MPGAFRRVFPKRGSPLLTKSNEQGAMSKAGNNNLNFALYSLLFALFPKTEDL
jgi:hypothetical protein